MKSKVLKNQPINCPCSESCMDPHNFTCFQPCPTFLDFLWGVINWLSICLQAEKSSDFRLILAVPGRSIIHHFSAVQSAQLLHLHQNIVIAKICHIQFNILRQFQYMWVAVAQIVEGHNSTPEGCSLASDRWECQGFSLQFSVFLLTKFALIFLPNMNRLNMCS